MSCRVSGLRARIRRVALFAMLMVATLPVAHAQSSAPGAQVHQLRIYEIFDATREQFHARFRDHAMRIMRRHGFEIVATWETRRDDRLEFAYLLQWPDEATMRERWASFMADEEWARIKRQTRAQGPMVGEIRGHTLHATGYSPLRAFEVPARPSP